MTRLVGRALYVIVAVVVCPLVTWNLAVAAADRGVGWPGFIALLLAVPCGGSVLAAALLRRSRSEARLGAIGAATATFVLVAALVFVTLSSR